MLPRDCTIVVVVNSFIAEIYLTTLNFFVTNGHCMDGQIDVIVEIVM